MGPGTYDHQPTDFVAVASANATIPDSAFATRAGRSAVAAGSRQQGDMPGPGTYDLATPPLSAVVRGASSIKEHTTYGQVGSSVRTGYILYGMSSMDLPGTKGTFHS